MVYDEATGKLSVEGTANQDTPAMVKGKTVMFGLDVWEHGEMGLVFGARASAVVQGKVTCGLAPVAIRIAKTPSGGEGQIVRSQTDLPAILCVSMWSCGIQPSTSYHNKV